MTNVAYRYEIVYKQVIALVDANKPLTQEQK
jgi:hypothetical protein